MTQHMAILTSAHANALSSTYRKVLDLLRLPPQAGMRRGAPAWRSSRQTGRRTARAARRLPRAAPTPSRPSRPAPVAAGRVDLPGCLHASFLGAEMRDVQPRAAPEPGIPTHKLPMMSGLRCHPIMPQSQAALLHSAAKCPSDLKQRYLASKSWAKAAHHGAILNCDAL